MAANSKIEWTDATWSPLRVRVKQDAAAIARANGWTSLVQIAEKTAGQPGQHCEHVSAGCKRCYSGTWQARCLKVNGTGLPFDRRSRDLVDPFVDEKILDQPLLAWKSPKKIFVENQSDLFGEWFEDFQIAQVFAVMALAHQHTFQVLTKREVRMRALMQNEDFRADVDMFIDVIVSELVDPNERRSDDLRATAPCVQDDDDWPLRNVWLGVSVEDQDTADVRIPILVQTPAAKRFISYEPALGPVDLSSYFPCSHEPGGCDLCREWEVTHGLDWVIAGGESGPDARPPHPEWFRSVRDQCVAANVPFFFKQWGDWVSVSEVPGPGRHYQFPDGATVRRVGKKTAGALLDGREWRHFPEARA